MRTALKCLALLVVVLLPATALAQASLTGTVRDASGAVLPGVTVEASSPALIEKVRTGVSDATVLADEIIQAIPAARAAGALLNATPGLFVDKWPHSCF